MIKQDIHVFQGMKQDNHPIRQESKYLWEAHNIRFTAREDNTMLSMTNEKGTKDTELNIRGAYIGHCVIGEYLVVFTEYTELNNSTNCIFRITNNDNAWECTEIYTGDLNMDTTHPAQTLGVYEGDFVQKVYWVDNKNQPRVINIVADKLLEKDIDEYKDEIYPKGCFDFIQELSLDEEIHVSREDGGGIFAPGSIQYAFSYYNKYGQESGIFYTTELLNTSYSTRGGSPEDSVSNTFHITINNVDYRFQYLRIYSIHRTSINATPTVKIVADLEVTSDSLFFIDTGTIGSIEDPTRLLYLGGEPVIAGTITEKDNTLFLGNIELIKNPIPTEIKTKLKTYVTDNKITTGYRTITLKRIEDEEALYEYSNQLSVGNTASFKTGDYYRLGLQFQYKTGRWSEPVWLGDYKVPFINKPSINGDTIKVPQFSVELDADVIELLKKEEYRKVRPLVVLPSIYDRMIIAQGVLCPTVFSVKDRISNTPFSQSSWFFRPMSNTIDNSKDIEKGAAVSFNHLECLKTNADRGAEIQCMEGMSFNNANFEVKNDKATNLNSFYVDQSILTLHSPDIEFDTSTQLALEENNFELNIIGVVPFKSNAGDISIETSSTVPAPNDNGFFHKSFLTTDYSNRSLVAGMFYKSHIVDDLENAENYEAYNVKEKDWELNWLVYPWHRSGSLNNDCVRPEGKGTRTAVLKRKVISNLKFSQDNIWLTNGSSWKPNMGITQVSVFNSNEVSLIKIPIPKHSGIKALNYYGNIDSLVTTDNQYTMYVCPNKSVDLKGSGKVINSFTHYPLQNLANTYDEIGDWNAQMKDSKEPVRLKYKSTPHAVFAINYMNSKRSVILPSVNNSINKYTDSNTVPFWSDTETNNLDYGSAITAIAEEVSVITGSPDIVESRIVMVLNGRYGNPSSATPITPSYIIATCSTRSNDINTADLYINTGAGWTKVLMQSPFEGNLYKASNSTYYWQVINDGDNFILTKLSTSFNTTQDNITINNLTEGTTTKPFLFMAELRRESKPYNIFGGDTEEALKNNLWIPAGHPVFLEGETIDFIYGDTYYQRYDCLKTYPFTTEDENSVVEIASFMCETRTNIDGRYDRNRGQLSNLNMSPTNFNLLNPVYSQRDNFFNYRILDNQYYKTTKYPTQILWSLQKSYLEDIDTWTNINLASSLELNGNGGRLISLESFNELLIAFQERCVSQIMFNSRVQIPTSDNNPVEISNNYKVDGYRAISDTIGCQDKWSIAKSSLGLYFVDSNTDSLYLYNGQLQDLSDKLGCKSWLIKYHPKEYWYISSMSSLKLNYDPNNKDLYLSPKGDSDNRNTLCYSEQLGCTTSLMSYSNAIMFPLKNKFMSLTYDSNNKRMRLWENFEGLYNEFYDEVKYPDFTYICNEDATYSKIFDTVEYRADIFDNNELLHNESFDWIRAYNEYQDSGIKNITQSRRFLKDSSLRKKFRIWRGHIPRDNRARIRNPWTAITLGFNGKNSRSDNFKLVLHDISTKYTV